MTNKICIKLLHPSCQCPKQMTPHAAGYDVFSANDIDIILKPGERKLIPTGFSMALPVGYEAQIRPRSGLALKNGVTVLNTPGTIDADYRGEVGVILINLGLEDYIIQPGSRIAQMIIQKHETALFEIVTSLPESERGEGGFGSTSV